MMTYPAEMFEKLDELIANCKAQVVTATKIKKVMRMADLLGKKPSEVKGRMRRSFTGPKDMTRPWVGVSMYLQEEGSEAVSFTLNDVHHDLWPADTLSAYQRYMERKKR